MIFRKLLLRCHNNNFYSFPFNTLHLKYNFFGILRNNGMCFKLKHTIDRSKVPTLNEDDLEEQFVRGHGPGGSNVNKRSNCVVLIHRPTGIVIKCHQSRLLDKNRQIARELLIKKLDCEINGENSISSQVKMLLEKKSTEKERKRKKIEILKSAWKDREGL